MKKSSPLLALSITALLLTGCVSNADPSAETTDAESGASSSATASPSPTLPDDSPTAAEPTENPESASPEPGPEMSDEPEPEPTGVIEPAAPTEAPITETSEPPIPGLSGSYDDLELVSTWDGLRVVRHVGTTWNIVGSGYVPGAEIQLNFGPVQTDSSLIGYPVVYADANGNYSYQISLAPDLAPGDYGVMAVPLTGLSSEEMEAAKRFAIIEVVSTWAP